MIETTFEIPTSVVIQPMEPVVDDAGVTNVSVMLLTTNEGTIRRFVFTTDDLRKVIALIEASLT